VIDRRAFIGTLAGGLLAAPLAAEGQEAGKGPRVGFLGPRTRADAAPYLDAFLIGLREIGRVEGKNIFIEYRWAEGRQERLPDLAAELVRLKVDVILAGPTSAAVLVRAHPGDHPFPAGRWVGVVCAGTR
jgi:putative ABC transport system substrate-binding protein